MGAVAGVLLASACGSPSALDKLYNERNELIAKGATTYRYDPNGNLIAKNGQGQQQTVAGPLSATQFFNDEHSGNTVFRRHVGESGMPE